MSVISEHKLMVGNKVKGVAKLMEAAQTEAAEQAMSRLTCHIDPQAVTELEDVLQTVNKYYQRGDAEILHIIGNGLIANITGEYHD